MHSRQTGTTFESVQDSKTDHGLEQIAPAVAGQMEFRPTNAPNAFVTTTALALVIVPLSHLEARRARTKVAVREKEKARAKEKDGGEPAL